MDIAGSMLVCGRMRAITVQQVRISYANARAQHLHHVRHCSPMHLL